MVVQFFTNPATLSLYRRSVDTVFMMAMAVLKEEPSGLCGDTSAKIEKQDVGIPSYSSTAMDESCVRGVFDKRRQLSSPAGAAAAARITAAPAELGAAFGFAGAFGGSFGNEQHPRDTGVAFGFGPAAVSAGSITGSSARSSVRSSVSSSSSSNSVGLVSAADETAAVTAAPWARMDGSSCLGQHAGGWFTPMQLLSAVPSARTVSPTPGLANVGGLGLLHALELDGAESAGLLDAADELLGEDVVEVFEQGGSEEDMLRFLVEDG